MLSKASMPGMRTGTDIIIYFDTKAILDSGVTLHQSPAGAVLTSSEVPANTTISVRARENGAVKYVNLARIEVCSSDEQLIAIGNDHEKLSRSEKVLKSNEGDAGSSQPPPPQIVF